MTNFAKQFFRRALWLGAALFFLTVKAQAVTSAPVVLAVNYHSPDPSPHIGSTITVYMVALTGTTQLNLTVYSTSVTQVALSGPELATLPSQTVYVTDSQRVWAVPFSTGSLVQLNNGDLMQGGTPPFTVADYTTMANQAFRSYTGNLLLPGPGVSEFVDIASYDSVQLYDDGQPAIHGDLSVGAGFGDGIWSGIYTVTEFGFQVSAGRLFGWAVNGAQTGNSPFQSAVTVDIDAVRPSIDLYKFSTTKPQYNGMLYVASTSIGSNFPAPTNGQGRFDVTVNKRDTIVNIRLLTVPPRDLTPLVFPAGATNLNGWKAWNGDDGNGKFVADGSYLAQLYIQDNNGVVGLTKSARVVVTSAKLEIRNIQFSPPFKQTFPVQGATDTLTNMTYDVVLSNESGTGIGSAMSNLGWPGVTDFNGGVGPGCNIFSSNTSTACATDSLPSTVYTAPNIRFIHPDGTDAIVFTGQDGRPLVDDDAYWLKFSRFTYNLKLPACFMNIYEPDAGPNGSYGLTQTVGSTVAIPDGDPSDDIGIIDRLVTTGPVGDPTSLSASGSYTFFGANTTPGNLRLVINETLTGVQAYTVGNPPSQADQPDACVAAVGGAPVNVYFGQKVNFREDNRGFGLSAIDSSAVFSIVTSLPPTSDTSPPFVVSSSPVDQSVVLPNVYGGSTGTDIAVTVQDNESPVQIASSVTLVRLFDSNNNEILGNHSTSGGAPDNSVVVKLKPLLPLNKGGVYKLTVYACNTGGLCLQKDLSFTLQDQTAPYVPSSSGGVELLSSTHLGPIGLSTSQTSPEGPFDSITGVNVTLAMDPASSNTTDWDSSNVSLYQVLTSGAKVAVPMTRLNLAGTIPSDSKLKYLLVTPIASAGLFEVDIQTFSKDSSGQAFSGPANPLNPRFTTIVNALAINIPFTNNPTTSYAVTGLQPVTITSSSGPVLLTSIQAFLPNLSALPADPGFTHLQPAADNHQAVQFAYGSGPVLTPLTWSYGAAPINVILYYNDADLPTGLQEASLLVRGYNGTTWQNVVAQQQPLTSTGNTFTIALPNGSAAMSVYAISYAGGLTSVAGVATPTPLSFKSTRSFSPSNANPVYRKARFYYSSVAPKSIDVRIFDTGGNLIHAMSLNAGVKSSDFIVDPTSLQGSYFFEWDGRNDNGDQVKNGLYLVRYQFVGTDNSTDTQVKAVALIK